MKKYIMKHPVTMAIGILILFYSSIVRGGDMAGFDFLTYPSGAKYAGIAGCDFGVTGEVSAIFTNPAALQITPKTFGFAYARYLEGTQEGYGAFAMPKYKGTIGIGIKYLNYGTFKGYDSFEGYDVKDIASWGTFGAQNMVATIGYSRAMEGKSVGVSAKAIYYNLAGYTGTAVAIDAGGLITIKKYEGLTVGAVLHNVGVQTSKFDTASEKLPFSASLGGSYLLFNKTALLSAQVKLPIPDNDTANPTSLVSRIVKTVGIEWYATPSFIIRSGYNSSGKELDTGTGSLKEVITGLTFGIGIKTKVFMFDYAVVPMGALGVVNHISFSRSISDSKHKKADK
ncbi:MAG: PorV/PorQ family protein [bacterium]|nr:PorV/PorQ family protein [bacterium]